jgi:adenine-specific DNA-methyltransferase
MEQGLLFTGKIEDAKLPELVDLIVSSPPYGIGKSYEGFETLQNYKVWATKLIPILKNMLKPHGAVCWQVGTHVGSNGEYLPLDILYTPIFLENGFILKNRIIWKFGSGLHSNNRLSGRYETILWFVLDNGNYTFNLDPIRISSKEPGKRSYKGPNKGNLSGNPLGKNPSDVWTIIMDEWECGEFDFPNVKSNHPEKQKEHPCQYPIELAERCVLAFSNENDIVLDPFVGTGSTGCASIFHNRRFIGVDMSEEFITIARTRIDSAIAGTLKTRKIGTPIQSASASTKTRQTPQEWIQIREEEQNKKPRLYSQWKKEDE